MERKKDRMTAAVCVRDRKAYEWIASGIRSYRPEEGIEWIPVWYDTMQSFLKAFREWPMPVVFLAFDDIVNQELTIRIRGTAGASEIVWIGEEKRFGLFSYHIRAANFLIGPVKEEEIWDSLDRCLDNIWAGRGKDRSWDCFVKCGGQKGN